VSKTDDLVNQAVGDGGSYEVIHQRLIEQGAQLNQLTDALNEARIAEFGASQMEVVARTRIRTENNCVGRDIVQVGDCLVFGYNVFLGLKKTTKIEDVFSLYTIAGEGDSFEITPLPTEESFLGDPQFLADFEELYRYYKDTRLAQLVKSNGFLLAGFQIGERLDDIKVFRWAINHQDQSLSYVDNRGERALDLPSTHDFEWTTAQREDIVQGRHPHINVLDALFVETINGTFTVKIENNTDDGEGIYSEPVDESNQSISDAVVAWAEVSDLIVLKVLPYKETVWRYFIYNPLNAAVLRIDAIGDACVQLPESHGVIFPDGFYLTTGEFKSFGLDCEGLRFKRKIKSSNGEDVLYVFYNPDEGSFALLSYNLISKSLQNPLKTHGYALGETGSLVVFTAEDEPTRTHPLQIWSSPYTAGEAEVTEGSGNSFYSRIGNAELVRGVSDCLSLTRQISSTEISLNHYNAMGTMATKLFDNHYWIDDEQAKGIGESVKAISGTVDLIIDEFEKVEAIRKHSEKSMLEAQGVQESLLSDAEHGSWESIDGYVDILDRIRHQRGHLATLKDYRYIDTEKLESMDTELVECNADLSEKTATFLASENAFNSYVDKIAELDTRIQSHDTVTALDPDLEEMETIAAALDLLSELISSLKITDPTVQTDIIDRISDVYSSLNQSRAQGKKVRENMGSAEAVQQFAAQFKLFSQSVTHAISLASTPEQAEEQLTRLLIQLEEIESQFGEYDRFLPDILEKREEIHDTFSAYKQQLLDAQQNKAQTLADAATRMLANIERRVGRFSEMDELNTYLASDALILKTRDIVAELKELDSSVKADEVEAGLKMIKDSALRTLRDKGDLYTDGGNSIRLGTHTFSVSSQELDLTIIARDNTQALHLVGTRYFEVIDNEELNALRPYWSQSLASESERVYRAEYLAYQILKNGENGTLKISFDELCKKASDADELDDFIKEYSAPLYKEGYQKGVHDHDAALILQKVLPIYRTAGLLRFSPSCRALAVFYWYRKNSSGELAADSVQRLKAHAASAVKLDETLGNPSAIYALQKNLTQDITDFLIDTKITGLDGEAGNAALYLIYELGANPSAFLSSSAATATIQDLSRTASRKLYESLKDSLVELADNPRSQWELAQTWVETLISGGSNSAESDDARLRYAPEVAIQLITGDTYQWQEKDTPLDASVTGLIGSHKTVLEGKISFQLDEFLSRLNQHHTVDYQNYQTYQHLRHDLAEAARDELNLESFKPKPLSSFVRNKLINDVYLPLIGDNLAKQIGTVGESKRSDLNGLLMMISPPGYGKTTLMEYAASRLGMTFMKINCPALGHDTVSLDPETAPNATAEQELIKINLSFEMGENVMLYLDDIQHTHPEFLQKFISLCDSTRRIEGVWKGKTQTYDLRGRKFCVVMAGNPYTESGEVFKVPDMLANRADIYNLGDVLSGTEKQFELSYIENSLSSNPVLAPLASRDMADVYKLVDIAQGKEINTSDLSHAYSAAEINEIKTVLRHMLALRDTVLQVNLQYISSAAQEDKYRVEPRFLLQGSYRNMNKLAEKVSAAMNEDDLLDLIDDHYRGEAQLLTSGTEANLLKLGELRGVLTPEKTARWEAIKSDYQREKATGGEDADAGQRIALQINDLTEVMKGQQATNVAITNKPSPEFARVLDTLNVTIEQTLFPLVRSMDKRIAQDVDALSTLSRLTAEVEDLKSKLRSK